MGMKRRKGDNNVEGQGRPKIFGREWELIREARDVESGRGYIISQLCYLGQIILPFWAFALSTVNITAKVLSTTKTADYQSGIWSVFSA